MGKKISLGVAISIAAIVAAIAVSLTYVFAMSSFNANNVNLTKRQDMYDQLNEIDQKSRQYFSGDIDENALNNGIGKGYMLGLHDTNSQFLTAEEYQEYVSFQSGDADHRIGVGIATAKTADGNIEVLQVWTKDLLLKKGDIITHIDKQKVPYLDYKEALSNLEGNSGSEVFLNILREEEALELSIKRVPYEVETVSYEMLNENIGYLSISEFRQNTLEHTKSAIKDLQDKKMISLILDLRGNTGGSEEAMTAVLDSFLPAGDMIHWIDAKGKTISEKPSDANQFTLPLSVLIDGDTSDLAEVFASNIQDYKKGELFGITTAGQASKSQVFGLSNGCAFRLSTSNYLTPKGKPIEAVGIQPDIEVALSLEQKYLLERKALPPLEDPQILAILG